MSVRTALRIGVVALAAAGGLVAIAEPSFAASPYIGSNSGGANVRSCANTGCGSVAYLSNGTTVTMVCYTDTQWVYPPSSDYASNRWFKINSPNTGYVHSSLIESQVSTPAC